ncbi:MAG: hypothetical protein IJ242_16790 [Clostridia bacterium]|nr:hypothetical protein [Clostridia bacterium]
MKKKIRRISIFTGLVAVVYLTVFLCNSFLLKRDSASFLPIHEIQERSDVEVVFIGSSLVRNGINPDIVNRETGLVCFDLGIPGMKLPGVETCIHFIAKKNKPRYIIVATEPDVFTVGISAETNMIERIWPNLETPMERLMFYLDLCKRNGTWIENALIFQQDMVKTLEDLKKVLQISVMPDYYAEEIHVKNPSVRYDGKGFLRVLVDEKPEHKLTHEYHRWNGDKFKGLDYTVKKRLKSIKQECDALNAKMVLMIPPTHSLNIVSYPYDMNLLDAVQMICAEENIPYWNFRKTRRGVWPDLDDCFYDLGHLSGTGADMFSEALGQYMKTYIETGTVPDVFYDSWEEYLKDTRLLNAWMDFVYEENTIRIVAGCNGGTDICPEYQFSVYDNGTEIILQDYLENGNELVVNVDSVSGKNMKVMVRDKNRPDDKEVYYECVCM